MENFATVQDVIELWRELTPEEINRAESLLPIVSDSLRVEAEKVGKNLDEMAGVPSFKNVLKSVTVDVVARTLRHPRAETDDSRVAVGSGIRGQVLSCPGRRIVY